MATLTTVAGRVSRALIVLADELREAGLTEQAVRCDTMSRELSAAVLNTMSETQKIDVPIDLDD